MTAQPAEKPVVRRPDAKRPNGTGRAGKRSFDIDDQLWFRGIAAAHKRGISLASVIRKAVQDFVDEVESEV